jgi:hypothetical protein
MMKFKREKVGRYSVVYRGECDEVAGFVEKAMNPDRRLNAGRGAPGVFDFGRKTYVVRQYLHGGWLRGITRGAFPGEKRASDELHITTYLEEQGFPVVRPFGYISRTGVLANQLFFITFYEGDARDLMEYFKASGERDRLRMARKLAVYFFMLVDLGVYHPDLHLKNVLVNPSARLSFLDFDKAYRKKMTPQAYEKMFWRLDRYVRKYSSLFGTPINDRERLIFLRTFERLSGREIISTMQQNRGKKERSSKVGWLIDRILYSQKS